MCVFIFSILRKCFFPAGTLTLTCSWNYSKARVGKQSAEPLIILHTLCMKSCIFSLCVFFCSLLLATWSERTALFPLQCSQAAAQTDQKLAAAPTTLNFKVCKGKYQDVVLEQRQRDNITNITSKRYLKKARCFLAVLFEFGVFKQRGKKVTH